MSSPQQRHGALRVSSQRLPPEQHPSKQYDLFTTFFGNSKDLSNTIEFWDAIPKYSVTPRIQEQMRDEKGRLDVYTRAFQYRPKGDSARLNCTLSIQPASILTPTGYRDFYPSTDEELVEEVIKKLFSQQQYGIHNDAAKESWVKFSLSMIQSELRARGKTRSITEIKRSIDILSKTVISLSFEGPAAAGHRKLAYTNPILNDVTGVTKADIREDPAALWTARLPALISLSITQLTYRQFNYALLMSLSTQLARWLHKRLSHEYTNAHYTAPYRILFSTIRDDSGLLHHKRVPRNVQMVSDALDELREKKILMFYKAERRLKERAIHDVLYTLTPHEGFVSDIKAANARASKARLALSARSEGPES